MKQFISVILAAAALVASSIGSPSRTFAANKPNILVIVADDLGYGELGCQGNSQIPTPNIDSLAKHGVRFTSGYVTAPLCSPSRAGILSGRYGQRFGFEFNLIPYGKDGIPVAQKIFPQRMKEAGYATGMFGKWHVGYAPPLQPQNRGFDWYFGFLHACREYQFKQGELGKSLLSTPESGDRSQNHTTEAFGAETAAFIRAHKAEPWFVYLPFNAVHASGNKMLPRDAFPKYKARFRDIPEPRRTFAGMLSAMDDAVGVVLAELRRDKLEENTLVFFIGDNGGPTWQTTSSNAPLSGQKGQLLEGGIREPFLVQWKGHLGAGRVDAGPVISLDILPTALAAAGAPVPAELDGINLLPYLDGNSSAQPHQSLAWRFGRQRAIRIGDWKLLQMGNQTQLFNLADDIAEKHDLAAKQPAKVQELEAAYAKWNAKNIPPKWGGEGKRADRRKRADAGTPDRLRIAFDLENDP